MDMTTVNKRLQHSTSTDCAYECGNCASMIRFECLPQVLAATKALFAGPALLPCSVTRKGQQNAILQIPSQLFETAASSATTHCVGV